MLGSRTAEQPGLICREVTVELVWALERAYGFNRYQVADIVEELLSTDSLVFEAQDDVARAALRYQNASAGFSDLMISGAAGRSGAHPLYTFDKEAARLEGAILIPTGSA